MLVHGFELVSEQTITERNLQAKTYRHVKTGARLLSLENDDENKVFAVAFATPPDDSTGLPHILEHSVLCGSRKYPVKEPFKELLKSSLKTFLNAFTANDATMYPVASQNRRDFHNLVNVYLDAVFFPLLTPQTLQQEGWHYETSGVDAPLTYKGVVYNEMKGNYSSPDGLIGRYAERSLFPDTAYRYDSGGDPVNIPDLTYEQFTAFHRRYYHPSNAYIVFYGDDHSDERLRLVDESLDQFEASEPAPLPPLQPSFSAPQSFVYGYDAGEEAAAGKSYLVLSWLLHEKTAVEASLAMDILSHILIGTQASPLRKALIDSGLGEDLTRGGFSEDTRQTTFSVGLKGMAAADADRVEKLILNTLADLARDGIDPEMIKASLNTFDFRLREANTGGFPRGVLFAFQAASLWMKGGDPLDALAFEAPLSAIKQAYGADPRYFESLIGRKLLHNAHRTRVLLQPDREIGSKTEAAERERLAAARAAMSAPQVQSTLDALHELERLQDTPDRPDDLARIPTLSLADLDRQAKTIPIAVSQVEGAQLVHHDIFTNGIVYLDVGFDLRSLPQADLPYAGLIAQLWLGMGTTALDFVRVSQRIGQRTGGIGPASMLSETRNGMGPAAWLFLRGKATLPETATLLDILREIVLDVRLDNRERLRQIVLSAKSGLEAGLLPGGHSFVANRLRSRYSTADWVSEQTSGVSYLFFIRRLAERIESDWPGVLSDLQTVQRLLVNRSAMLCNVTVDETSYQTVLPHVQSFIAAMPAATTAPALWQKQPADAAEGMTVPAQVNFVGKGANLYDFGFSANGSLLAVLNILRNNWLWERVRMQGGAYGAFVVFDDISGTLAFLSYRDPNLLKTLEAYDRSAEFLRKLDLAQGDVEKAIIGAVGALDAYQLPDARGWTSLARYLNGTTDDFRQSLRERLLATTAADFTAFADAVELVRKNGAVVVLGSDQAIAEANKTMSPRLQVTKVL